MDVNVDVGSVAVEEPKEEKKKNPTMEIVWTVVGVVVFTVIFALICRCITSRLGLMYINVSFPLLNTICSMKS